jgi:Protein of unknown function (DUF3277).
MGAYSFLDVAAALSGPGGNIDLGAGSGSSEEGLTVEMAEAKNTMTIGADGSVMHSMHAGKGGTVTFHVLKTSPVNAVLMDMYNYQSTSSARWGQNTITIRDIARGDTITCQQCAFQQAPSQTYAKDGNTNAWAFAAGMIDHQLGSGTPERQTV